jgi:hypothetical protein
MYSKKFELDDPLPILEKGKYELDKAVSWKFVEMETQKYESRWGNGAFFKSKNKKDLMKYISGGLKCDHICVPDANFRCEICGKILKWVCYGPNRIVEPYEIYYFPYKSLVNEEKEKNTVILSNFTEINHLIVQREMAYYLMC